MSKSTPLASCSNERAFIRQSLFSHKVRLDGRGCEDYRELDLRLDRTESTSSCELKIGSHAFALVQYAVCAVVICSGLIVTA